MPEDDGPTGRVDVTGADYDTLFSARDGIYCRMIWIRLRRKRTKPCRKETQTIIYLFIYLIRQMAANSKIHNEHKSQ